jgi:pilus assembly protein CpaC
MKTHWLHKLAVAALALLPLATPAQLVQETSGQAAQDLELVVPLYKSRVLSSTVPIARVSVGNPDVADILILRARELYVLGKDLGTTNVLLWNDGDQLVGSVAVEVTHDLDGLKRKLFELFPNERIDAYAAQRSIVLSGSVSSVGVMDAALQLARGYLAQVGTAVDVQQFEQEQATSEDRTGGQIINLLQVGGAQQVMLEVKVAEIQRTELKRLHARFNAISKGADGAIGGVNGGARFPDVLFAPDNVRLPTLPGNYPWGPAIDEFAPNDMTIANQGLFGTFINDNFLFNLAVDAAKEKGLAKVLAEPTLTTLTGQEAEFLSGGQFPIPISNGLNGVTVEFKKFGVGLKFLPVVLSDNRINLKINVSVSELVDTASLILQSDDVSRQTFVPSLRERSASATVELGDGQSMGLAGLLDDNLRELVTKFPGLGDIPVLGALFRSNQFQKGQTELVIMVTPRLAKPVAPGSVTLPTDKFVEPTDAEFYWKGQIEGGSSAGGHQTK